MSRGSAWIGVAAVVALTLGLPGCGAESNPGSGQAEVPGHPGRHKSSARRRAVRRAFDGAPPTIPHLPFGAACTSCHTPLGMEVAGVGFAPPSPHGGGPQGGTSLGATARCVQCHVFHTTPDTFVGSNFEGLRQDLRRGGRLNAFAPPVMPHPVFMRENCLACHSGPTAREEIRTPHPERIRCLQCHLEQRTTGVFDGS